MSKYWAQEQGGKGNGTMHQVVAIAAENSSLPASFIF